MSAERLLLGGEEKRSEEKKKSLAIYINTVGDGFGDYCAAGDVGIGHYSIILHPPNSDSDSDSREREFSRGVVPPGLSLRTERDHSILFYMKDYAISSWESKIYFIGGEHRWVSANKNRYLDVDWNKLYSPYVFAYDTKSSRWVRELEKAAWSTSINCGMKIGRSGHTAVVASRNHTIYVFGGESEPRSFSGDEDPTIAIENWGESYNINTNNWDLLPPPPRKLYQGDCCVPTPVYYEKKNQIFIWYEPNNVFIFDIDLNKWLLEEEHDELPSLFRSNISRCPPWSNGVAIVGDILFWHHFGLIYAYDLAKDKILNVGQHPSPFVEDPSLQFGYHGYLIGHPNEEYPLSAIPTFLLSLGDDKLCVVWRNRPTLDQICCYSFTLKMEPETVSLQLDASTICKGVNCHELYHALAF